MAAQSNVNESLSRRRDSREAEHMMQESMNRMTEITGNAIEVCQSNLALCASMYHYWGDCMNAAQTAMDRVVDQTQQMRRTGTSA